MAGRRVSGRLTGRLVAEERPVSIGFWGRGARRSRRLDRRFAL